MKHIKKFESENTKPIDNMDLFWAVKYIYPSYLKKLLEEGADPNIKNRSEYTPLYAALLNNKANDNNTLKMLKYLVKYGADPLYKCEYCESTFFVAISKKKIKTAIELIKLGADYKEKVNNKYFIDFLSDEQEKMIKEKLPDVYNEYLILKDMEKYNI